MIQVWYEQCSEGYPKFCNYKFREEQNVQKYVFHKNLKETIEYTLDYPKYKHVFMLDENKFSFFRFDISQHFTEKFTITDLQDIIRNHCKIEEKKFGFNSEKLTSYVDTIYVDGEEKKYLIGQQGHVFFRLYIIYIEKKYLNIFNSYYGNILEHKNISIVPASLHTLIFLRNNLSKENFILLYIQDNICRAIKIQNGFYHSMEELNLGINSLRQMYKDNDIMQYRNKSTEAIEANPLAKGLISKTIEFYSQLMCKWMFDRNLVGTDIIVISSVIKNSHFIEIFNKEYMKYTNNYIVPFHYSEKLNDFGNVWEPEDMDALILLNKKNT